jgi:ribosomal protein S19
MMLYYNFKPTYISRSIENFEKRIDIYKKLQLEYDFFKDYIYKDTKAMRERGRYLILTKSKYYKYVSPSAIFKVYTKNSVIPSYILGKNLLVHRGLDFKPIRFLNPIVIDTKLGHYIPTKNMGKNIHKGNIIEQKVIKKQKQLLALSLQRKARKSKQKQNKQRKK